MTIPARPGDARIGCLRLHYPDESIFPCAGTTLHAWRVTKPALLFERDLEQVDLGVDTAEKGLSEGAHIRCFHCDGKQGTLRLFGSLASKQLSQGK